MTELMREMVRRTGAGEPCAVCLLARTAGSTPQKTGAVMLVFPSGEIRGTIGGGCVEAEVRTEALRRLARAAETGPDGSHDALLRFALDQDYGWDDGLICGGVMFVAVQVLDTPAKAEPWRDAAATLSAGRTARVGLRVPDAEGRAVELTHEQAPDPTLVIAGAGHVGGALAAVAGPMGFAVTVIDDREDAVSEERFPGARRIVGPIADTLGGLELGEHHYVVIVTRGHRRDGEALGAVVGSSATYVGLIGSRRKILAIHRSLRDDGVSHEQLTRVRAPIGLRIGAVSPEEIAVSIAAELVAVRRGADPEAAGSMRLDAGLLGRLGAVT